MDLVLISNLMVAGGTIALAYFTFKSIKSSEKQLKFLRKQTQILNSQQEPYLLVQDKEFKGNKIELYLSNHGGGTAYEVAVETEFYLVEVKLTNESEKLLSETPKDKWDKLDKLSIQGTYNPSLNKTLLLENNKEHIKNDIFTKLMSRILKIPINYEIVYPSSATTFIFSAENEQSILKAGEKDIFFELEPYFFVTTNKLEKKVSGYIGKSFLFDELKEFLLKNNIQYIGITFYIVSRDKIGKVHRHQQIDSCIVDLNENKTLEEAINSGRKVRFTPLGWLEIQKKFKWLPSFEYNEIELGKDRIE
jgi:hypothetical protein